ncbi:hypothetical protein MMC16_007304 [Acarospora aff. strigata]|nr:hypothetical protein [Acarospora aff. strigata]
MSSQVQSDEFKEAVRRSDDIKSKPQADELLQLYAFYKQGIQDPPIDQVPAPGAFDMKAKAKKRAWQKVVDEGVAPEEAQKRYIAFVDEMLNKYGDKTKDT